jgi:hypothetical protein
MFSIPVLDIPVLDPCFDRAGRRAFIEIAMCNKTEDKWLWAIM